MIGICKALIVKESIRVDPVALGCVMKICCHLIPLLCGEKPSVEMVTLTIIFHFTGP